MSTPILLPIVIAFAPPGAPPGAPATTPRQEMRQAPLPSSVPTRLQKQLRSPQKAVRLQAVRALKPLAERYYDAMLLLMARLEDPDADVRALTLESLHNVHHVLGGKELPRYLKSRFAEAQIFAMRKSKLDGSLSAVDKARVVTLIQSPLPTVRIAALQCTHSPNNAALIQAVRARLTDLDAMVRSQAARTLYRLNLPQQRDSRLTAEQVPLLPLMLTGVKGKSIEERAETAEMLHQLLDAEKAQDPALIAPMIPVLITLSQDKDSLVRDYATGALGKIAGNHPDVAQAMLARLNDTASGARASAAGYFVGKSPDFDFAVPALLALAKHPFTDPIDAFSDSSEAESYSRFNRNAEAAQQSALEALATVGVNRPEVPAELLKLKASTSNTRYGAFDALIALSRKKPDIVPSLIAALPKLEPNDRARRVALLLSEHRNHADAFALLTRYWESQPSDFRRNILVGLGHSPFVGEYAAFVVVGEGMLPVPQPAKTPLAFDWLASLLQDKDPKIRGGAARVIAQAYAPDDRVLSLLLPLRNDPDPQVRTDFARFLSDAFAWLLIGGLTATDAQWKDTVRIAEAFAIKLEAIPAAEKAQNTGLAEFIANAKRQIDESSKQRKTVQELLTSGKGKLVDAEALQHKPGQ